MPFCSVKSYLSEEVSASVVMLVFLDLCHSSGFRCDIFNVIKQDKRQTEIINKFICDYLLQPRRLINNYKPIDSIFHIVRIIFTERKATATEHMDISIKSLLPHLFKIRLTQNLEPIHNPKKNKTPHWSLVKIAAGFGCHYESKPVWFRV